MVGVAHGGAAGGGCCWATGGGCGTWGAGIAEQQITSRTLTWASFMFSFLSSVLELSAKQHADNALSTTGACSTTSSRLANLNRED